MKIAIGLILGICLSACQVRAAEYELPSFPTIEQADTAVAAADVKQDKAAAAPVAALESCPSSGMVEATDLPLTSERKSRLTTLKERLYERMGRDPDCPIEELPPPPPPAITLRQPQCLQDLGIRISGWLQQGVSFNGDNPANRFNGPVATNDRSNDYQLNQFWMTVERPINTSNCGFDIGGRIDAMYGTDWRFGINNGLEDRINGFDGQSCGVVIPQAYVQVGVNDLSVKLGHFAAILDYEMIPAPANFFYSHSYGYGYGVPQLVTGLLAEYKLDGGWSVQAGLHRGWSQFEDNNHSMDVLAGLKWQSCDKRTSFAYALSSGPQDPNDAQNRFVYSLVAQQKIGQRSQYVLVHDLGIQNNTFPGGVAAQWYGLNQYFIHTLSEQWSAALRVEWFRDDDGVRVAGPGNIPGVRAWSGHGFAGNFYEISAGLNWRPHSNVIFRPEIRYDWYDGSLGGYGPQNVAGLPFNDGNRSTQFLTAADLIVLF